MRQVYTDVLAQIKQRLNPSFKGVKKKDRFTILSAEMLELLRFYFIKCRPENGLVFNGRIKGKAWSERAAQRSFKLARRAAGLPEFITALRQE